MSYAGQRRVIDADSHLFELDDFLHAAATDEEAALLPAFTAQRELPVSLEGVAQGRRDFAQRQINPEALAIAEKRLFSPAQLPWSRLGAFDPAERSHVLDLLGFERQLVLGTFSFHQVAHVDDLDVLEVGARVHNRAMARFCAHDDRMDAIGYLPLSLGPERAGDLLDEALSEGVYTVTVDTNESDPNGRSFTHPDFDPVWARFADADVPFVVHIAVNGHYDAVSPSFHNNGRHGVNIGGDAPSSILGIMAMNVSVELFLSAMIFDEVFERHPGLRGISMEHGASWVPGWLDKLDFVERTVRRHLRRDRPASEVARERLRFCPFANEPIGRIIEQVGPDLLCFASDYPHPEGTADPIGRFDAAMDGIDEVAQAKFYAGNLGDFLSTVDLVR